MFNYLLPLLSTLSAGTADFLYKRGQSDGIETRSFYFVHAAAFTTLVAIYTFATQRFTIDLTALLYSLVCGVLSFISFYAMLMSLKQGEAGTAITVTRLGFAVTAGLALLFLGESITWLKILGLLAAITVVILFGVQGKRQGVGLPRRSLYWALTATITHGVRNFVYKLALLDGVEGPAMLVLQAFIVFLLTLVLRPIRHLTNTRTTLKYAAICATMQVTAVLIVLWALSLFEASIVVPISQMSFVVTALLAAIFLGERLSPAKIAGTACAVTSVLLLSGSA